MRPKFNIRVNGILISAIVLIISVVLIIDDPKIQEKITASLATNLLEAEKGRIETRGWMTDYLKSTNIYLKSWDYQRFLRRG